MRRLTINIHQVGFIPLYLPFYIAVNRVAEKLNWNLRYHVGISDADNIKRACRFKFEDKDNLHIVLTALHNLKIVREESKGKEKKLCENCNHKEENKCEGVDTNMVWFFPWIFIIKLPVYVFLKGEIENNDIKTKIERVGIRYQLDWQDIKELLKSDVKKIYIYPEGATINDAVLNHIFGEEEKKEIEIKNINFDVEHTEKHKIDEDNNTLLVFTLNPHLYENDLKYKLIMRPPHNFFPFTGIAIPVIKSNGVSTEEMKFIYHLEEEYINFMTCLHEAVSPFFKSGRKEDCGKKKEILKRLKEETETLLKGIGEYSVYKEGEYKIRDGEKRTLSLDIDNFFKSFMDLYNDGVFREHTENVVIDYLKEHTLTTVTLFDPEVYKARIKDATAYVFGRNLSHVYGSNVIPYAITNIDELDKNNLKRFFEFLQERMDYIATIISDDTISPYAFIGVNIKDIVEKFNIYRAEPFLYLYKSASAREKLFLEICKNNVKDFTVAVPPILYDQAFYSIFENILRNAAKYGVYEDLEFTIDVEEYNKGELIKITIIDKNVEKDRIKDIVEDLNRRLKKALVDPYLNINYEGWGLKEAKISSAYLRGIPLERIDLEEEKYPIISVIPKENGIGFVFYLYPFKNVNVINIDKLKDTQYDIPSEFIVVKGEFGKESILNKQKYTRIFIEKENHKEKNWKYYADIWLNMLKGTNKEVREYFVIEESDYKKFYEEISKHYENYGDKIIIAYVRHLKDIGEEKFYEFLKNIKKISPYSYIHSLKGAGSIYNLVDKASKGNEFIKYKLIESALLRVLILDERVQEKVRFYNEIELRGVNIYVPKTSLVEAVRDEEEFNNLCKEIEEIRENYKPHIVVVHVSLPEQADKNLEEDKFMEEIFNKILKDSDIMLTTGRGRITSKYRYIYGDAVPISHILKAFDKEYINKYLLSNILIGFNRNLTLNL